MRLSGSSITNTISFKLHSDVREIGVQNVIFEHQFPYADADNALSGPEEIVITECKDILDFKRQINKSKYIHVRLQGDY